MSFELREAFLVYQGGARNSNRTNAECFVTQHKVLLNKQGVPSLEAGAPITKDSIQSLVKSLRGSIPTEFLPENVLVRTEDTVVWWCPASIRPMFYTQEKGDELKQLSGKRFPQPPLLFRVDNGSLDIRALRKNERPTLQSKLCRAPYWNVSDNGDVCLGSTRVPRETTVSTLAQWESSFFESEFTHPNGAHKLTEHRGGFIGLWKELIGKKKFPPEYLADAKETLEQFTNR